MTSFDETELRHWLVDYLVTNIGCSPNDVDFDASLKDLGVGSRDAVVLSGELSELLGRAVSPVEFWQHPTINALAHVLTTADTDTDAGAAPERERHSLDEPIAVVGLGCRFPGDISGPEQFWEFLQAGRSAVSEVPPDRWPQFDDGSPEVAAALSRTTRWGSFLNDVDAFDADFFEVSPSEAAKMDPQQRLLLEVACEALEHAGIPAHSLKQTQTGVFAGASVAEYGFLATTDLSQVDAWSGTGGALCIIANRLSYFLDLRGPSVTVDTACSSSLVAVHLACQSLRTGDSDLAIAAGVNLMLSPAITHSFDQVEAMSPTGQCHAFDAGADGYVRGEGCGVAVLKRLADAVNDGDRVLAVVAGSAVNQDGRSNGLMAPNPAAQMAVLRAAYTNAAVEPQQVDYVEAHGTGTLLGDPIEARALGRVLGRARPQDAPLLLGAVKSNLGHLEAAAGIAGFIKAVLAVQRGHIPPNLHFSTPNPHIPFDNLRLKVVDRPMDWPTNGKSGQPRRAGVSAFGFGGTNAHVVLEQGPQVAPVAVPKPPSSAVTTLVVSGKSDDRIASTAETLADWMDGAGAEVSLAEVAHTLNHHRSQHPKFATVAALDRGQAVAGLRALAAGESADGVVSAHDGQCRGGTVFVYSGQGSQWPGMGRQLLADEPAFAAAVAELDPAFIEATGFSLREVLAAGQPVTGIERIQPVLVGIQLALTELWRSYGVEPDAVIGHSMGEVTAAVVAGALTPAEGLKVIATRSRLMARLSGQGAMALLELDADSARALIDTQPDVSLAVYASPRQSVIAGPPEQVDALIETVAAQEKLARRIDVDVASHHSIIDPVLPDLRAALADLRPRRTTIPVISTVEEYPGSAELFDADYWAANLRKPVRFSQAVAAAAAEHGTFVEISPHPVLTYAISDTLANVHHHSLPTLQRDAHDTLIFHTNLNATRTVKPPSTDHPAEPPAVIPTTPWHHTRHWIATKERVDAAGSAPKYGTLLGAHIAVATSPPAQLWQARLLPEAKPYPGFHRLHGVEVVPVSVLMQTISAAAAESGASSVSGVHFEQPVVLDRPRVIQVVADGESITVSSRPTTDQPSYRWVRHVSARLSPRPPAPGAADSDVYVADSPDDRLQGGETRSVAELLEAWGVEGQPFDWSVESLRPAPGGAIADVRLTAASTVALLDAAVHVARLVDRANPRLMIPAAVDSVWLSEGLSDSRASVEIRRLRGSAGEIVVDIVGKTPDGTTCVDIRSLRYVDVEAGPEQTPRRETDPRAVAHVIEWRLWQYDDGSAPVAGTLAVVGGADAAGELQTAFAGAGYHPAALDEARYVLYLAESAPGEADIDAAVRMSAEVSDLVRLLAARDTEQPGTLWILTRGVREAGSAQALAQGALWGLARVIGVEHPTSFGGLVDLAAGDLHCDAGAVVSALSTVLPVAAEPILALRDGQFLMPALVRVPGQPVREPLRCHLDAAYLITGGLGVLGLLMATWLADRGARRLILAGRTALPPRRDWDNDTHDPATRNRIAAIRALEMRGVAVEVVSVDIGSRDAVQALVDRRDREGAPPIRGVIHAAGVAEGRLLADTREETFRRVMWPKIAGGQALRAAFAADELDFLYLAASAGTVFGIPGQGAYAAANAYLDCLAHNRHHEGGHTVSLDWVAWRGLGFGSDAAIVEHELQRLGSRPIAPEEAFAAWEFIDSYDVAQAVMAPDTSAEQSSPDVEATAAPAREWSALTPDEIAGELETGLRAILARELRIPEAELEVDRPFAELGLNSVMAMSIRREAERLVGVELSATMLWNHPTIASLTTYLVDKLSPQQKSGDGGTDVLQDSSGGVLDSLFDEVESTPASADSGMS